MIFKHRNDRDRLATQAVAWLVVGTLLAAVLIDIAANIIKIWSVPS